MNPRHPLMASVVLLLGLVCASAASAQPQPPWRWFTPKPPDKNPPGKSALPDARRMIEINVEVAWLADPVTFPYYLEAHVNPGQQLEVRGYVPNKAVREQALRTAQVFSSLAVIDSTKEHPSLLVRPSPISAQQLQSSVVSSLRAALPKQYQQLRIDCAADGKVFVSGTVNSYEEKITVSHSLRRLHGCTSVQNFTAVPADLAQAPPEKTRPSVELKGPALVDNSGKPNLGDASGIIKVEHPMSASKLEAAARELQKCIHLACPKALRVEVSCLSMNEVRILVTTRSADEISPIAERIFAMPELRNYRPDLQFKIVPP
jgi:hypothetical protein